MKTYSIYLIRSNHLQFCSRIVAMNKRQALKIYTRINGKPEDERGKFIILGGTGK